MIHLEIYLEAAMRQIVGDRTVERSVNCRSSRSGFGDGSCIQTITNEYEMGIKIEQVVQDANPPDPVKPSYNGVNEAEQQRL